MEESRSLYQILLIDQAPAAAAYSESRADICFSPDTGQLQLRILSKDHVNAGDPNNSRSEVPAPESDSLAGTRLGTDSWASLRLLNVYSASDLVGFNNVRRSYQ
jgi:hypothetical protein